MFYEINSNNPKAYQDFGLKHNPLKALIVPRPIGWITTLDGQGRVNLAPYSFFNVFSGEPPVLAFGCGRDERGEDDDHRKDTQKNIEENHEFVFNLATYDLKDEVKATSDPVARGVDEMQHSYLASLPSRLVGPPRVAKSPVHLECRYLQTIELPSFSPENSSAMVLGQVIAVHIEDNLIDGDRINILKAAPLCRLGYADYAAIFESFKIG